MQVKVVTAVVFTVLLVACATKTAKSPGAGGEQQKNSGSTQSQAQNAEAKGTPSQQIQDGRIMDLSNIDATEENNWMNPNNPPGLKRQYQKDYFSVLLPEDIYPVKTGISPSSWLFKVKDSDAYFYMFVPKTLEASALLDINLNSLELGQAKGYHDMVIDLKDDVLKMSFSLDGSNDGYTRYVEVSKDYRAGRMSVGALITRDQAQYSNLRQSYRAVLKTVKPALN